MVEYTQEVEEQGSVSSLLQDAENIPNKQYCNRETARKVMQANQAVLMATEDWSPWLFHHRATDVLCEEALSLPSTCIRLTTQDA